MIIKSAVLDIVCGVTSKLPDTGMPEVAFAGKSNVGKSSLINGLMNRKSLARTSAQPGKTQTINFYKISEAMYLVYCLQDFFSSVRIQHGCRLIQNNTLGAHSHHTCDCHSLLLSSGKFVW